MSFSKKFDRLVNSFYEAATSEDEAWISATLALSEELLGSSVVLDDNAVAGRVDSLLIPTRFDTELVRTHFERFATPDENPGVKSLMTGPVGQAFHMHTGIDPEVWSRDLSVASILKPQGITEGLLLVLERSQGRLSDILIYRGERGGAFSTQEVRLINSLAPHLKRALSIRQKLGEMVEHARDAHQLLQELTAGLLVTDAGGRVLRATGKAHEALVSDSAIYMSFGRLRARDRKVDDILHKHFEGKGRPLATSLAVPASEGQHLLIREIPAAAARPLAKIAGGRVFVVEAQDVSGKPDALQLRQRFGLTPAEAEVAVGLARGSSLEEIAAERGNSLHTVRTYLKVLFQKTETRRQSQLVAILHHSFLTSGNQDQL